MTELSKPTAPTTPAKPAATPSDDAYHPEAVEAKWQAHWAERHAVRPSVITSPAPRAGA